MPKAKQPPQWDAAYHRRTVDQLPLAEGGKLTYWLEHGISQSTLESYGVGWDTSGKVPLYTVPYKSHKGEFCGYHALYVGHDQSFQKWRWSTGSKTALFAFEHLISGSAVVICEGEPDTMMARQLKLNACGLPGAKTFTRQWAADLAAIVKAGDDEPDETDADKSSAYPRRKSYAKSDPSPGPPVVYLCLDNDDEGIRNQTKIRELLRAEGLAVRDVSLPAGMDVCDYVNQYGGKAFLDQVASASEIVKGYQLTNTEEYLEPEFPIMEILSGETCSFIDNFWSWSRPTSATPHEFLIAGALSCIAAVIRRRVCFAEGSIKPLHGNLYTLMVAESSVGCKSTAADYVRHLLLGLGNRGAFDADAPNRDARWVLPRESSPESLQSHLEEQNYGLFLWGEFSAPLQGARKKYMQGFIPLLLELYDVPELMDRETMSSQVNVTYPVTSILAGIQPEYLDEAVEDANYYMGFLPRFLLMKPRKDMTDVLYQDQPQPVNPEMTEWLINWLHNFIKNFPQPEFNEVGVMADYASKDVAEYVFSWTRANRAETLREDGAISYFLARSDQHLKKLMLLMQLGTDYGTRITMDTAVRCCRMMDHQKEVARYVCLGRSQSRFHALLKRVEKAIMKRGGSCSRSDLLRSLHVRARELDEALEALEATGQLRDKELEVTGAPAMKARQEGHYTYTEASQ